MDFINSNFSNEITLKKLSYIGCLSEYHLSRIFRLATGYSISEYIRKTRIKKSIDLLLKSDLSVTDIALNAGYNSISNFYNFFKIETGISPSDYRNKHNSNILEDFDLINTGRQ